MKKLLSMVLALTMAFSMSACGPQQPAPETKAEATQEASVTQQPVESEEETAVEQTEAAAETAVDQKAEEYLESYFGIAPMKGEVDADTWNAALAKIDENIQVEGNLTLTSAVKAAVELAGLKELALVYGEEKAAEVTEGMQIEEEYASYVACAVDAGLASKDWDYSSVTGEIAAELLYNAVEMSGRGRRYLGYSNDPEIYRLLSSAWATFGNFDDEKLSELGAKLVIEGASTGYNLKFDGYNANFLPEYTLQYGHSDIIHAVQLIALLNSENIVARVALEPKTSIYEYMVEWGDPSNIEATPTYELKPIEGGRYLCYATEYDMKLEFNTVEEKDSFDALIGKYAKKWDSNTDGDGNPTEPLLAGAWWQPLYTSTVPMTETENYKLIHDNVIRNGQYTIHPFSTVDGGEAIAEVMSKEAPELSLEVQELYVNNAFYNYLTGADHQ